MYVFVVKHGITICAFRGWEFALSHSEHSHPQLISLELALGSDLVQYFV